MVSTSSNITTETYNGMPTGPAHCCNSNMDSSNDALASLQLDDGATTPSGESNVQNKHQQILEHEQEADGEIPLPYGPETSVILEDGLFVRIASFCKGKELLRMCTLTKSDMQQRCELVLKNGGIKKDPRSFLWENRSSEESWASKLRKRIALDMDLVFTVGDPFVMEHPIIKAELEKQGRSFPNRVIFSWPALKDRSGLVRTHKWSGAICGREEQAMRTGVHRAIFTISKGSCRIGILGAFALQENLVRQKYQIDTLNHVREYDTYERIAHVRPHETDTGLTASLAAAHNVSSPVQVGLEIDVARRQMRVYRSKNFRTTKANYVGSVMIGYPSAEGYFWAVFSSKQHAADGILRADGECSIEKVPGDMTFESFYRPESAIPPAPSSQIDANMVHGRQPTAGRFRNSSTRRHFDPYSSPPPSP